MAQRMMSDSCYFSMLIKRRKKKKEKREKMIEMLD